jgi:hypothetical protein
MKKPVMVYIQYIFFARHSDLMSPASPPEVISRKRLSPLNLPFPEIVTLSV